MKRKSAKHKGSTACIYARVMLYLGFCHHNIFDDMLSNWFIVFHLHVCNLVASDLAMLLVGNGRFPGNTNGCWVHWFHLHFSWWSTRHCNTDPKFSQRQQSYCKSSTLWLKLISFPTPYPSGHFLKKDKLVLLQSIFSEKIACAHSLSS